jgi:hypothetical protein
MGKYQKYNIYLTIFFKIKFYFDRLLLYKVEAYTIKSSP